MTCSQIDTFKLQNHSGIWEVSSKELKPPSRAAIFDKLAYNREVPTDMWLMTRIMSGPAQREVEPEADEVMEKDPGVGVDIELV